MTKKFLIFAVSLFLLAFFQKQNFEVRATDVAPNQVSDEIVARKLDPEAQVLAKYLAEADSPLQFHAQDFVDAARIYGLDWKMLPAIAGVESTFGKNIPGGYERSSTSYNAWGWGVYGNQAIYFDSWRTAIFTIASALRENYLNKGLTDPYSINKIYAASPTWGGKVSYFMNDLDRYAKNYQPEAILADIRVPSTRVAATSGLIAFR